MSCGDWNGDYIDALAEWAFRDAVLCTYQTSIGGPEFATIVLGAIGMSYLISHGSPLIAVVIFVVAGGVFMGQIAGIAVGIVTAVLLAVVGAVPVIVLRKMSRS